MTENRADELPLPLPEPVRAQPGPAGTQPPIAGPSHESAPAGPTLEELLSGLNERQRAAVEALEGPVMVVAGPGSGKTRVLTHRIAALLAQGVPPWRVLAVTFTNKAAQEMRARVASLVGEEEASEVWMSTFHSLCARILRRDGELVGLPRAFSIADADDTRRILRRLVGGEGLESREASRTADAVASAISLAKNRLMSADEMATSLDPALRLAAPYYARYAAELAALRMADFDDLLLKTLELLRRHPEVTQRYRRRFAYILVDEYQDTNAPQYEILRALLSDDENLCVVGDLDQCLVPGTPVTTPDGFCPIEDVVAGMKVLSAPGTASLEPALVTEVRAGRYEGRVVGISAGGAWLEATPLHLVPVRRASPELDLADIGGDTRESPQAGVASATALTMFSPTPGTHEVKWVASGPFVHLARRAGYEVAGGSPSSPGSPASTASRPGQVVATLDDYTAAVGFAQEISALGDGEFERRMSLSGRCYELLPAGEIRPGMVALVSTARGLLEVKVDRVEYSDYAGPVYDLEIESVHNYVAGGILVHNSIYSWRGASPDALGAFGSDFPSARVVVLDRNYRSTEPILAVARAVIEPNPAEHRASLWTDSRDGAPVVLRAFADDRDEAAHVASAIAASVARGTPLAQHAVLYRVNALSRSVESELTSRSIPYVVVGGQRFYERAEVKDALAYLRTLSNGHDALAFARAAAVPRRRLGESALAAIADAARAAGQTLPDTARQLLAQGAAGRATRPLEAYLADLDVVRSAAEDSPAAAVAAVLGIEGFMAAATAGASRESTGESRRENLAELVAAVREFCESPPPDAADAVGLDLLGAFLEHVSLVSGTDVDASRAVQLMTVHAAKGREFDRVWVIGVEDDMFPHVSSSRSDDDIAEERRLLFVAVSRAARTLELSWCRRRFRFGEWRDGSPSSFLVSLPDSVQYEGASAASARTPSGGWERRRFAATASRSGSRSGSGGFGTAPPPVMAPPAPGPRCALDELAVGTRVVHDTFGPGVVTGLGTDTAAVRFADRERTLAVEHAPMRTEP